MKSLTNNTEMFQMLSKPFIRQNEIKKILGCSQSHISKLLKENKIIDDFGLGYSTEKIIRIFRINMALMVERMRIEKEFEKI